MWLLDGGQHCKFLFNLRRGFRHCNTTVFGLSANAIWYIFYATASDYAPAGAIGTANSLITVAQYVGGAVAPIIMGYLLTSFGGWHSHQGYIWCFLLMSCCAFIGVILQMILGYLIKKKNQNKLII